MNRNNNATLSVTTFVTQLAERRTRFVVAFFATGLG